MILLKNYAIIKKKDLFRQQNNKKMAENRVKSSKKRAKKRFIAAKPQNFPLYLYKIYQNLMLFIKKFQYLNNTNEYFIVFLKNRAQNKYFYLIFIKKYGIIKVELFLK